MERTTIILLGLFLLPLFLAILTNLFWAWSKTRLDQPEQKGFPQKLNLTSVPLVVAAAALSFICLLFAFLVGYKSKTTAQVEIPLPIEQHAVNTQRVKQPGKEQANLDSPPHHLTPIVYDKADLIDIILKQQGRLVGKSSGLWAEHNFTDEDLKDFIANNTTQQIVDSLKSDGEFLSVVAAIKSMPPAKREKLLREALLTYKRTWTELRMNPKKASPEELMKGQTEAGQQAEKLIAQAIVRLVRTLLQR